MVAALVEIHFRAEVLFRVKKVRLNWWSDMFKKLVFANKNLWPLGLLVGGIYLAIEIAHQRFSVFTIFYGCLIYVSFILSVAIIGMFLDYFDGGRR